LVLYEDLKLESYGIDKAKLLQLALVHDIPEIFTGDIPVSVKQRKPEIKILLDEIESEIMLQELNGIFPKDPCLTTKFIVKVCDYICVRLELFHELSASNNSAPILKAVSVVNKIYDTIFGEKFVGVNQELKNKTKNYLSINFNDKILNGLNKI
jgi:hypothetical protein